MIPICIGMNAAGRLIAGGLGWAMPLETVGTALIAFLAGPLPAGMTGLLTNLLRGVALDPAWIPLGIVNAGVGVVAGALAARGWLRKLPNAIGLTVALAATIMFRGVAVVSLLGGRVPGAGIQYVLGPFIRIAQGGSAGEMYSQLILHLLDKVAAVAVATVLTRSVP